MSSSPSRLLPFALILDLVAVVTFVVAGRRTHQESSAIMDIAVTLAPFAMGLALAWLIARIWVAPASLLTGTIVWAVTMVAGMFTRRVLFGEGIAPTFIVVTALFLAAFFLGWRLLATIVTSRRPELRRGEIG